MPVRVDVDRTAGAAYMTLNDRPIVRTIEVSDDICVDLDVFNMVVGIELLDLRARSFSLSQLDHDVHIASNEKKIIADNLAEMLAFIRGASSQVRQQGAASRTGKIMFSS